jgi:hypothetical protein
MKPLRVPPTSPISKPHLRVLIVACLAAAGLLWAPVAALTAAPNAQAADTSYQGHKIHR